MKIAIVGSGISGMGAAYLLSKQYSVTLFEANDYLGGHSRTIEVPVLSAQSIPVDTGFIVFNYRNYPHLTGLFSHLEVPVEKSDMSFGVSVADGWLEYSSKGMFAQRRNLLRPRYWQMLVHIVRFNRKALGYLDKNPDASLKTCLDDLGVSGWFRQYYLQAMGAAIWSCSVETILEFPARTFIQFFNNHGLLTINDHPQWYTVTGGSREYVKRLTAALKDSIHLNTPVVRVERSDAGVAIVTQQGARHEFDQVVFACHADQALRMMADPSAEERSILGSFSYQENSIVTHRDVSYMPARRGCWASWIYRSDTAIDQQESVGITYWMNNLQNIDQRYPIFVTLNAAEKPSEDMIYDEHIFSHPVFNAQAIQAQKRMPAIQGKNRAWFAGAYLRYGFHEDGLLSAVKVAEQLGVKTPW